MHNSRCICFDLLDMAARHMPYAIPVCLNKLLKLRNHSRLLFIDFFDVDVFVDMEPATISCIQDTNGIPPAGSSGW